MPKSIGVARLRNEAGRIDFFEARNFSRKMLRNFPDYLGLCCGSAKIPQNSRKISLPQTFQKSPTSFCRSAGRSWGVFLAERIFSRFLFLGRRIFSRIFSPDFSPHLCGQKCPEKSSSKKSPSKSSKNYTTKIPDTFLQRGRANNRAQKNAKLKKCFCVKLQTHPGLKQPGLGIPAKNR